MEGTFTICSFWLVVDAHGDWRAGAGALCEKLLSYASPLDLYADEIDPHTGRQLGNFDVLRALLERLRPPLGGELPGDQSGKTVLGGLR